VTGLRIGALALWLAVLLPAVPRAKRTEVPVGGTLSGRLLDAANGNAIPGAEVTLIVSRMTRITGVDGRFSFGDHDVRGPDTLVVRHLAYDSMRLSIDRDLGPLELELELAPRPIPVEGVDVSVDAVARGEARRIAALSDGFLWEREEFERFTRAARHIVDPLRWSGKVTVVTEGNDGSRCVVIRMRHGCARILINNVYVSEEALKAYAPEDIESYVVIGPIDATLMYGTGAAAGVVVVYTRGRGR